MVVLVRVFGVIDMAYYIGNTLYANGSVFLLSNKTTAGRPANPVTGQIIYNTETKIMEIYDQGLWKDVYSNQSGGAYLYKNIITKGYVMGGYVSSTPWRNVNRMNHATDVMTNLGDLLMAAGAYTSGANNLTRGFLWNSDGSWPGSSTQTVQFSTVTETGSQTISANWNTLFSREDPGTVFQLLLYAYITGNNAAVDVFNLTTEIMAAGATGSTLTSADGTSAHSGETSGVFWNGAVTSRKLTFSTGITYTIGTVTNGPAAHGQQKGICTKLGRGYAGNEGSWNGGYNLRRWLYSNETYTTVAKPIGNSGEENFDYGQAHQYMMGMYDTAQNNRGWKFTYATDTGIELGAGSVRTGVPGGPSGHCAQGYT